MFMADRSSFAKVDKSPNPQVYLNYLSRLKYIPAIQQCNTVSIRSLDIKSGQKLLDVGSGLGEISQDMARITGKKGRVIGVDNSNAMVTHASSIIPKGLKEIIEFKQDDATDLTQFTTDLFDGYIASRLYQHLADPKLALSKAKRVLKRNGRIVIIDTDWHNFQVEGTQTKTTKSILATFISTITNPKIVQQLPDLLAEKKFTEINTKSVVFESTSVDEMLKMVRFDKFYSESSLLKPAVLEDWLMSLRVAEKKGVFRTSLPFRIISGKNGL